jgi:hypothetical protein
MSGDGCGCVITGFLLEVAIPMRTLRQMPTWLLAGAVLALTLPARAAEVDKLLPDDSEIVLSYNVKQIVDSPLFKKHLLEKIKEALKSNEEVQKHLTDAGFDPFKDLTKFTTAMWSIPGPGSNDPPKFLLIARGNFDPAKIDAKAEEVAKNQGDLLKIEKEGDNKIYAITPPHSDGKSIYVQVLDKSTIVGAMDKEVLQDAAAKASGKKKANVKKEMQELIKKIDGKQSAWVAVSNSAWNNLPVANDETAKKIFENTESIHGGLSVDKDVKFSLTFTAKSNDAAKDVEDGLKAGLDMLKGQLAMTAAFFKPIAPLVDIVGAIQVSRDGGNINLKSEVSEEIIEKSLKDQ